MSGSQPLTRIRAALDEHGILVRGVANFNCGEGPLLSDGASACCVVLLGNIGGSMWPAFSRWRRDHVVSNPLDTWSKSLIQPLATALNATAYFPSDPPYQPFQQWAMQAERLTRSPLGILFHPQFGLWHGYRGALGLATGINDFPRSGDEACDVDNEPEWHCDACPVGAVSRSRFDVRTCHDYLSSRKGQETCMVNGCAVRNACEPGAGHRYPPSQLRFHMEALVRAGS